MAAEPVPTKNNSWWWIPLGLSSIFGGIVMVILLFTLVFAVGFAEGFSGSNLDWLLGLGVLLLVGTELLALILAPVGFHFDRKYVAEASEWTPSDWYYLTWLGGPGVLLSTLYICKRYKHVGLS